MRTDTSAVHAGCGQHRWTGGQDAKLRIYDRVCFWFMLSGVVDCVHVVVIIVVNVCHVMYAPFSEYLCMYLVIFRAFFYPQEAKELQELTGYHVGGVLSLAVASGTLISLWLFYCCCWFVCSSTVSMFLRVVMKDEHVWSGSADASICVWTRAGAFVKVTLRHIPFL